MNTHVRSSIYVFVILLQKSGLSEWMSDKLTVFGGLPDIVIALILSYITAAVTNVTSNAATATLFLPIVGGLVSIYTD